MIVIYYCSDNLCGEQDITLQDFKQILEWNFSSGIFNLRMMWMDHVEYNSNLVCLNQRITKKFMFFGVFVLNV
jgi:hypothetical protein